LEEERAKSQSDDAAIALAALQTEFETKSNESKKMIGALRASLRKTRKELSETQVAKEKERVEAVNVVREKMNKEVANLKNVLKAIEDDMKDKDTAMQAAKEGLREKEQLMNELRNLRQKMEMEEARAKTENNKFGKSLSEYARKEEKLSHEVEEKEESIAKLTNERDANAKHVEVLKLEVQVLESKLKDVQNAGLSNIKLLEEMQAENSFIKKEKSSLEDLLKKREGKIASLQQDLTGKQQLVSATRQALRETRASLKDITDQYEKELKSTAGLKAEFEAVSARMATLEFSAAAAANDAMVAETVSKEKSELQTKLNALTVELKDATAKATQAKQSAKKYEAEVQVMTNELAQYQNAVDAKEAELSKLKGDLARLKEKSQEELTQIKNEMSESLAYADSEIQKRDAALQTKGELEAKLNAQLDQLKKDVAEAQAASDETTRSKSEEAKVLQDMVETLQKEVDKEVNLRTEVLKSKEALEATFQGKVSALQNEIDDAISKAEENAKTKTEEVKKMEAVVAALQQDIARESEQKEAALKGKGSLESTLQSQIEQLKKANTDIENARAKAQKEVEAKADELNKMEKIVSGLRASIEQETKLREEAQKGRIELEAALQKKIERLNADTEMAIKAKNDQIQQMTTRMEQMAKELSTNDAQINDFESKMKSMIAQITESGKDIEARDGEIAKLRNALEEAEKRAQSTMSAEGKKTEQLVVELERAKKELNESLAYADSEIKDRDEAIKTKDAVEAELQTKLRQLEKDIESAKAAAAEATKAKIEEAKAAEAMVANLKKEIEKEVALRTEVMKGKEMLEASFQGKVDQLQLEQKQISTTRASADKEIAAKNQELKKMEKIVAELRSSIDREAKLKDEALRSNAELERTLQKKTEELKKEISSVNSNAEKTIQSKNDEIKEMANRIDKLSKHASAGDNLMKEYEIKVQNMTKELEKSAMSIESKESKLVELQKELEESNKRSQLSMSEDAKNREELLAELQEVKKELSDSLAKADEALRVKDETLELKESFEEELQAKIEQLQSDIATAQAESEAAAKAKTKETKDLEGVISTLKKDIEKETNLRLEVLKSKEALEDTFKEKKDGLQKEIADTRARADAVEKTKAEELKKMESVVASLKSEIAKEIKQREAVLKSQKEITNARANADNAAKAKDEELMKMKKIASDLKSNIEQEVKLKEEALRSKSELEATLKRKMKQLESDIIAVTSNAEKSINEKKAEVQQMQATLARLRDEIKDETKLKEDALDNCDQLEVQLSKIRSNSENSMKAKDDELKQKEALIADLKADIIKQTKLKDLSIKEKETLESELLAEIIRLKNSVSTTRINAENTIKVKNAELMKMEGLVSKLNEDIARESELKESVIKSKSELETVSKANAEDMEKMEAEISALKAQMQKEIKTRDGTLNEKAVLESELQATISKLKDEINANRANLDVEVSAKAAELQKMDSLIQSLKNELRQQAAKVHKLEEEAETSRDKMKTVPIEAPKTAEKTVEPEPTEKVKSTKKPLVSSPEPESETKSLVTEQTTAEALEMERKARLAAAAEAKKALAKTQMPSTSVQAPAEDQTPKAATVKVATATRYVRTSDQSKPTNLKDLLTSNTSSSTKTFSGRLKGNSPSSQASLPPHRLVAATKQPSTPAYTETESKRSTSAKRERKEINLKDLIGSKVSRSSNAFPERLKGSPPSSQASLPPHKLVETTSKASSKATDKFKPDSKKKKNVSTITEPNTPTETNLKDLLASNQDRPGSFFPNRVKAKSPSSQATLPPHKLVEATATATATATAKAAEKPQAKATAFGPVEKTPEGTPKDTNLKDLLSSKSSGSSNSFPNRSKAVSPSSQASAPPHKIVEAASKGPEKMPAKPGSIATKRSLPLKQESTPASKKETTTLKELLASKPSNSINAFPSRSSAATPSSQATAPPKLEESAKKKLSNDATDVETATDDSKPISKKASVKIATATKFVRVTETQDQNEPKVDRSKKTSLRDLLAAQSKGTSVAPLPAMPEPESKQEKFPPNKLFAKVATSVKVEPSGETKLPNASSDKEKKKQTSLKDYLSKGKPIGSSDGRKAATKLGGMANVPDEVVDDATPTHATGSAQNNSEPKMDSIEPAKVKASLKPSPANMEETKKQTDKPATDVPQKSFSSLSNIVQTKLQRPGWGRTSPRARPVSVRDEVRQVDKSSMEALTESITQDNTGVNETEANSKSESTPVITSKQEEFQRSLLAARIANDAKAAGTKSRQGNSFTNLSQLLQGQKKSTMSNRGVVTGNSLFPTKKVSKLGSFLKK